MPPHAGFMDFGRTPFLVIWETTRACALACVHCRASAVPCRDPRELTTEEGCALIDQIAALGEPGPGAPPAGTPSRRPLFVLTGGDPMLRKDLAALVAHAAGRGLTVALTPSGTAAATRARLAELKSAGLSRIAVSLDGPSAEPHDAFRRVRGSYGWTMRIIDAAIALDLPLQINSTISRLTLPHLEAMAARVSELPIALWALFFLIRTGRGESLEQISAEECERVLNYLYDLSLTAPFGIKTTEAPHYQRVVWQREHGGRKGQEGQEGREGREGQIGRERRRQPLRAPRAVNDGNGFVFVDHIGNICPSGFLPAVRGNIRTDRLDAVYRHDEMFVRLRHSNSLLGKCGRCRFREICGGSRSRAFAATGAVMASDPLCVYEPGPAEDPIGPGDIQRSPHVSDTAHAH
ncbi:MAG: TIGR04053 family radical SAM/SPASM domain-containing protein [Acidobacteria bacterium]|nr:TIGR04053 family radical SAM/SPASM domain-containing protein [Acidobacteriota bacterium]